MEGQLLPFSVRIPPLTTLQSLCNDEVVAHFCRQHPEYNTSEAVQVFKDLLSWMWLTLERKARGRATWMFGPLLILDAMWHSFILHTRAYCAFCEAHFGTYFHHDVESPAAPFEPAPEMLEDYLSDCFAKLGEAWVMRYFGDAFSELP
ncbi:hypothetical protein Lgee_1384 [Legionella geestiana]|uniref:Uncharacterized protein n=1 Tax=Legionella geestiana TaxID=45065 RepID=A0A0W0TUA3_9GAMM|nr:hypothetical protein [Legionella geestiana]KTC98938.1 hypothetical protein Lgee_1384 [Legionella geestiana]STX54461.1 Uncharacterized conserved protein [Legionella geestiana]